MHVYFLSANREFQEDSYLNGKMKNRLTLLYLDISVIYSFFVFITSIIIMHHKFLTFVFDILKQIKATIDKTVQLPFLYIISIFNL